MLSDGEEPTVELTMSALPSSGVEEFSAYVDATGRIRYVGHIEPASERIYTLEIRQPDGFVPKMGLVLAHYVQKYMQGKKVLDVGTGETGILAIHAAIHGASKVVGVDIDEKAVAWAEHNGVLNGFDGITWRVSDVFSGIEEEKFDVIVSNPPQTPMPLGLPHDWGGVDGRRIVERIIMESPRYLIPGGQLFLILFDFLGIERKYGLALRGGMCDSGYI